MPTWAMGMDSGALTAIIGGGVTLVGAALRFMKKDSAQTASWLVIAVGFGMILFGLYRTENTPPRLAVSATSAPTVQPQNNPVGPVTVDDISKCPPGYVIFSDDQFDNNGKSGISAPADAKICLVNSRARGNKGNGLELRPK